MTGHDRCTELYAKHENAVLRFVSLYALKFCTFRGASRHETPHATAWTPIAAARGNSTRRLKRKRFNMSRAPLAATIYADRRTAHTHSSCACSHAEVQLAHILLTSYSHSV